MAPGVLVCCCCTQWGLARNNNLACFPSLIYITTISFSSLSLSFARVDQNKIKKTARTFGSRPERGLSFSCRDCPKQRKQSRALAILPQLATAGRRLLVPADDAKGVARARNLRVARRRRRRRRRHIGPLTRQPSGGASPLGLGELQEARVQHLARDGGRSGRARGGHALRGDRRRVHLREARAEEEGRGRKRGGARVVVSCPRVARARVGWASDGRRAENR